MPNSSPLETSLDRFLAIRRSNAGASVLIGLMLMVLGGLLALNVAFVRGLDRGIDHQDQSAFAAGP